MRFLVLSVLTGGLVAGIAIPFAALAGLTAKTASDRFQDLPAGLQAPLLPQRTIIEAADGSPIATIWGDAGNRVEVSHDKIAPVMRQALVSIEDNRFYSEGPLDLRSTLRALITNASTGDVTQGGSTLTQQYVKNVLLTEAGTDKAAQQAAVEDTVGRKLQELKYATEIDKDLSKDQILDGYLNLVNFGESANGVEAAAERYFSTTAAKLTLTQAATLAAIVKSPTAYDPIQHPQNALARRNLVLRDMAYVTHAITPAQAAEAEQQPLGLAPTTPRNGCITAQASAAFFCQYVVNELRTNPVFGKTKAERQTFLDHGDLTIRTTMVPAAEEAAQTAIFDNVAPSDSVASDMVIVQPGTGQIQAMAQSRSMGSGQDQTYFNYATSTALGGTSGFQAGSTFKAFVALAALEQGIAGPDTEIDSPYQLTDGPDIATCVDGKPGEWDWLDWQPTNQTQAESGANTMTSAFAKSVNTYFIQLEEQTGLCDPARIAQSFGVTQDSDDGTGKPLEQYGSFTLGTNLITPVEMANAYATLAADGKYCKPTAILSVTSNTTGEQHAVPHPDCRQVIDPSYTQTLTSMLEDVIQDPIGTGYDVADPGRPAAGKTGTNDSMAMTWFDGYTPNLAAAVWVGDPDHPNRPETDVSLHGTNFPEGRYIGSLYGSAAAAPIWGEGMKEALDGENLPVLPFTASPAPL
ncbi:transglycosylase domain-containing protein [Actinopolymorpha pittospori]|uniref:Membrane peptidoglycan carboxypeptidase n=1 Tax=Actinopolymorpha pittospori TaxID=648752 RepID=A0A927RIL3_9ACTN|nr:membrane peptidoglycan carboxypeptidase [Actinopolymorpha pittospori]